MRDLIVRWTQSECNVMPGASWMRRGKPIEERTTLELVGLFVVLPMIFGGLLVVFVIRNAVTNIGTFTLRDWIGQFAFAGLLGLSITVALPCVALQEFRKRRAQRSNSADTESNRKAIGDPKGAKHATAKRRRR